jgi:tetratricopeptide (TPR) repeat protein
MTLTRQSVLQAVRELKRLGRHAEAQRQLEDELSRRPGDLTIKASLADLLVRTRHLVRARALADEVLQADPDNLQGLTVLGSLHLASGHPEQALEAFRLAAFSARTGVQRLTPYLARQQARALTQMGEIQRALDVVSQALALHPSDPSLETARVSLMMKLGQIDAARDSIDRLKTVRPDDPEVRRLALEARTSGRAPAEVVAELDRALSTSVGRGDVQLWTLKAKKASEAGQWSVAAEAYLEAHRLDGRTGFHLRLAGFAFKKAGDLGRAIECLEPAFMQDPSDVYVRSCLLACVKTVHGPAQVRDLLERARQRHPEVRALLGLRRKAASGGGGADGGDDHAGPTR